MEKILSIEEVHTNTRCFNAESGFKVTTDKQVITLMIDSYQQCCETWGYFFCNDDTQDFIGSALYEVSITDTALNTEIFNVEVEGHDQERRVMFVNLQTSKGTLQFVAYNAHNGYYGHHASVKAQQLTHKDHL